jgi:CRP-like cAMP-binding protein
MTNAQSLLQNVYLFKDLTPKELELVTALAKQETLSAGDEVFTEGDVAHSLYILKFGSVKIQHSGKSDRINVATLGTGSHFGEMAFLDGEKRSASVQAIENTELVRLDFNELKNLLDQNPVMAVKVYRALANFLCGRLRVTTTDLSFAREKNLRHF